VVRALRRVVALAVLAGSVAAGAAGFDAQGHRGARGLAPENTLAAFERALALGVTTIETDVAITKDDVPVIAHDPFLNPDLVRGPDGTWLAARGPAIRSLTLDELARYDIGRSNPASDYAKQFPQQVPADGQRFPTLAQVLALGRGNAVAEVDPKTFAIRRYFPVGRRNWGIGVSPQGTHLFAANGLSGDMTVIDLAANKPLATIPLGGKPWGVVVAP
jgi:YVTN family beta-propeller protein